MGGRRLEAAVVLQHPIALLVILRQAFDREQAHVLFRVNRVAQSRVSGSGQGSVMHEPILLIIK